METLFNSAPRLEKWEFKKFRPRRSFVQDLTYGDKCIAAKDVFYRLMKDGNKVGIFLFLDGYNEQEKDLYGQMGFLFLDEALGEYDMETKVGFIEFQSRDSKNFKDAYPLSVLAEHFDDVYRTLN
ncbi:MAG: hypothetical protein JNN05_01400 [Candidatus Omnitrophica bacterium]|nr:hypothetical protein [Candidatus Omnitrophota bacterium]